MSNQSRYNQIRNRRPPHARSASKISGSGLDDNQWYKCRFCGFINKIERSALGDGEGNSYLLDSNINDIVLNDSLGYEIGITGSSVLVSSHYFSERHNVESESVSGCSLCGSLNWK